MGDILFYNNYTPVADISTIMLCAVHILLLHSSYVTKQKNLMMFRKANALLFLAAASNIAFHEMIQSISTENVLWIYIVRNISYFSLVLICGLICEYMGNTVNISGVHKKRLDNVLLIQLLLFGIFEFLAPITKMGFYIDDMLEIHQNYYADVFRFAYICYMFVITTIIVKYRKRFITKMFYCICGVLLGAFILMVLQAEARSTSYTCISFAFPLTALLFLFHHNSYDIYTGTLDGRVFDDYVRDLHDKKFTMVCLYLHGVKSEETREFAKDFQYFNEQHFRRSCIFRVRDDKLIMVYEDARNHKVAEKVELLLEEFIREHEKYRVDYRFVIIHSDKELNDGADYLAFNEFIEEKLPFHTLYCCEAKEIRDYRKVAYILGELQDICACKNLEDERGLVFCQPVLNTETNTFTSAESLMRIVLPECGMVYPDQFIPLAEKYEYIHMLSKIILNKTCMQIKQLEQEGYQIARVSINFSILELRDKNFCEDVIQIIKSHDVACEKIAIELTESRNEEDFENVKNIMTKLQQLGVKFYLDDFGTGYSNFERIIGLPIDIIKFDRSLTILAGKNESSRYMVGSFSDIFKKSDYQILFEGIEDEQDEKRCKEMNALYLQGYKYSRPIPMEELKRFLEKEEKCSGTNKP